MAPKDLKEKDNAKKKMGSPFKSVQKDSTVPASLPTTSTEQNAHRNVDTESGTRKCLKKIYDKENKTCLGRTCKSWLYIIMYSIVYLIFLSTYTMIFLFITLTVLKYCKDFKSIDKIELLTYSEHGIGLSATPTSENTYPFIWYKIGSGDSYRKYVNAIDRLLLRRSNISDDYVELGPCSRPPYGYGSSPCIIIRVNKQLNWAGKPLYSNSSIFANAPSQVKELAKSDQKLWLHCDGHEPYDKEHKGKIKYYPNPPGIDPKMFPVRDKSPLVAVQISDFTQGISISIQCTLWYEHGPASIEFVLYVEPEESA